MFLEASKYINRNRVKLITLALAMIVSATALMMAAAAAWQRGGTMMERELLLALSVSICLGTHLIPAVAKNKLAWLLWIGCLSCAIYSHLTFFTYANSHAGDVRAQRSSQVMGLRQQIEVHRMALDEIKSRPITVVALELANSTDYRLRRALRLELGESRRAAILRDDLVHLTSTVATAEKTDSVDPVTALLASVTGSSDSRVDFAIWIGTAFLLELLGALLWVEVLFGSSNVSTGNSNQTVVIDPISSLRNAITTGECKPTVAGIRVFLRCGQARAMMLRRAL
jgi:hypothetical protein